MQWAEYEVRLFNRALAREFQIHNDVNGFGIMPGHREINSIAIYVRLLSTITRDQFRLFDDQTVTEGKFSFDGLWLCLTINRLDALEELLPEHDFHPLIGLLKNACSFWGLVPPIPTTAEYPFLHPADFVPRINRLTQWLRDEASTQSFLKSKDAWRRRRDKNVKSIKDYFKSLLNSGPSLLVVRLTIGLLNQNLSFTSPEASHFLKTNLAKLIRKVRFTFPELRGTVAKLEMRSAGQHRLHVVFAFNGGLMTDDIELGESIGEIWTTIAAAQGGIYLNCNKMPNIFPGLGLLIKEDALRCNASIGYIADYLTRLDVFIKYRHSTKTLFRGLLFDDR